MLLIHNYDVCTFISFAQKALIPGCLPPGILFNPTMLVGCTHQHHHTEMKKREAKTQME